jgi:hypothetical protein
MIMTVCKNCGVELEVGMQHCPLCGEAIEGKGNLYVPMPGRQQAFQYGGTMSQPQKKFTWEIISIILLSGIIATFIIDFIINKRITWSEYPVAISLVIFSYLSLFAFWHQRSIIQMAGSFILSSIFLFILDVLTGGVRWSIKLGIPLLLAGNLIVAVLTIVVRRSKYKGINLIAYAFLGAALLCICVEGILSIFKTGAWHFEWSVIVAGCIVPVFIVLLFVHLRLKKGRSLEKTFHV